MAMTCKICRNGKRAEIDKALVKKISLRTIADRFNISKTSLIRHKDKCLPVHLVKAEQAQEAAQAGGLLAEMRELQIITLDILSQAENAGDLRTALYGVSQARGNTELLCKMLAHLEEREQRQQETGQDKQAQEDREAITPLINNPLFMIALQRAVEETEVHYEQTGQGITGPR